MRLFFPKTSGVLKAPEDPEAGGREHPSVSDGDGAVSLTVAAPSPSALEDAYDAAVANGMRPLDLSDTFAPARPGRILAALEEFHALVKDGPCDSCGVRLPRQGIVATAEVPRFHDVGGGARFCDWCWQTGGPGLIRSRVLQGAAGLRSADVIVPSSIVPLWCELELDAGSATPWEHLDITSIREWATANLDSVDFKRFMTPNDIALVPGVPGPAQPLRSTRPRLGPPLPPPEPPSDPQAARRAALVAYKREAEAARRLNEAAVVR